MTIKIKAYIENEDELSNPETLDGNYVSIAEVVSFFVILDLLNGIEFANDVLGHRETVTIGGINGVLEIPTLPNTLSDGHRWLVHPKAATTWKCDNDQLFWGYEIAYPAGIVRLTKLLIEFQVPASKIHDYSILVRESLGRWCSTFFDFHDLLTKNPVAPVFRSTNSVQHELFILDAHNQKSVPFPGIVNFYSPITKGRYALSRVNFIEICRLCSTGSQPSFPYRIQLQAYRAMMKKDYRKAVIESAVAAEIVLTQALENHFKSAGINYGDKIMQKFRTLGPSFELAKIVDVTLPDINFIEKVVNPRNLAIHQAKSFESSEAYSVVRAVDQLLQMLSPQYHE